MDELHQFATDLAHSVVEQSMRAVSSNFTNANDTELPITPHGFSNCGKCVNEMFCPQEPFILDNESNSATVKGRDGKYSRPVKLKCYAHDLCCDIISGALHNLDGPVREVSTSKFRGLSSHANNTVNCHQLSTERIELFCYCDKRATITMCAAKRKIANSSGKPKPITRAKKKKLKYKKKLEKELSKLKPGKSKNDKFLSSIEKDPPIPIDDIDDTSIICPVCLDFYFNAHTCKPCDHTFCEPCLRRLAKYCGTSGKTTSCPVCREPIHHCQKDFELTEAIMARFPDDYRRRRNTDANSKYMNHPLPSQPTQTVDSAIISHILRRRHRERLRHRNPLAGYTPMRINFKRYISIAVCFVMIKALALMIVVAVYNAVLVE